jgi:hypothetical protein
MILAVIVVVTIGANISLRVVNSFQFVAVIKKLLVTIPRIPPPIFFVADIIDLLCT